MTGTGVACSTFGVTEGVTDFDTGEESTDAGRCDSARRLAWRGCGLDVMLDKRRPCRVVEDELTLQGEAHQEELP